MHRRIAFIAAGLLATLSAVSAVAGSVEKLAPSPSDVVELSRQYLAADQRSVKKRLADRLASYTGDIDAVIAQLATSTHRPVKPGYYAARSFSVPELAKRHPDDLLYFVVPHTYDASRPTGLIVFLHGGGPTTRRHAPRVTLHFPTSDEPAETQACGDLFDATGMITVGPSAPVDSSTSRRWCVPEADQYLVDVIHECESRYNIDPDRVFLLGHSMGGFGAYHHALRSPDRFAAVIANSGSWSLGYWPAIRGCPLCTVQGVHDARRGQRWHYTDITYGRWTDKLLTSDGLEHTYLEHNGEHSIRFGREKIAEFFKSAERLRRDPYYPHVTLATPNGFSSDRCYDVRDNRWISLDEAAPGELEYDALVSNGADDFDDWRLSHRIVKRRGAMVDAINEGHNRLSITTKNVKRLTVWLHPKMFDVAQPVHIFVNGVESYAASVKPSLLTALDSYGRREDWRLVYPVQISLELH